MLDDEKMTVTTFAEGPDCSEVYYDTVFMKANKHISDHWVRIGELYPEGVNQPLLPATFTRDHFGQGNHYECFMLTALSTLVRFPDVIQNCFVSKNVRRDGRYTFRFFRGKKWVAVEIDDSIPLEDGEVLYMRSPTKHWWPLLLEKAYAKFYTGYENLEGCTLQEAYHDLTGNPVLSIPIEAKMAKAAGADVMEGHYWLDLAQRIQSGQVVASVLTNDMELENMGLQCAQQYGILEIFSLTGTSSVSDIVIHLHNPFEDEEFLYKGPLNSKDPQWTPKLRARYAVDDARSAFVPLQSFHNIINSMQLCYMASIESEATYFDDEWKGETAGGNPTSVTWRNNPLYTVRNASSKDVRFLVMIKQEDKRRSITGDNEMRYNACGFVLSQCTSAYCIPSFFVAGNNHKHVFKSLFLEAREVTNIVTVPAKSLCYLVPFCMKCGVEGKFTLALYKITGEAINQLCIEKLRVPEMDWAHPAEEFLEMKMSERDRVDFYVDAETDIHILMHQKLQSNSATGNNAVTENYIGMYLYDDTDKKIGGVHAASNFRESSILHHLPRSGRYAISVTCPRAKDQVSICIKIVGSSPANARIVDAPPDACMFDDEDIIEGGDVPVASNPIDDTPINFTSTMPTEVPDTTTPFEDKRFMIDNRSITNDPWIHIGDLYPEGKTQPLIPDRLSCDQFEQGEHFECCCLTAFATLVDHHPDVIRNLFVTKNVRKDCRYTFQFHRYGQWVKVEIDDRIPMTGKNTLYCRSPSRHWWPLLLEKAYAKFYTIYDNLEGCGLKELFYDFTGLPVISIPTNTKLARSISYDIDEPLFWLELNQNLNTTALGAFTGPTNSDTLGLLSEQSYGVIGVFPLKESEDITLSDLVVKIYNPYHDSFYTGPMNPDDHRWTSEHRLKFAPESPDVIYMPVDVFCDVFESVQQAYIKGLQEPSWHFNSEWGEGTNGGNPTLVTWRENPLYVIRNTSDKSMGIVGLICQPDQRHMLHKLPANGMEYHSAVLVLAQEKQKTDIPTFLVTFNNHRIIFKGLFFNCREVASFMVVPPKSLCYLVPSCMGQEKSKFLLSYWLTNRVTDQSLGIVRYKPNVSRSLSAIKHLELRNKEQDRVDFLVDVPTDIHILLRQEKPFTSPYGDDIMAEDFVGMYLYDENNKRIGGVLTAMNYREMGIVQHLPSSGRYALSVTCPRGNGTVPAKVEVVGVEHARVRITDPPEDSGDLMEVDLGFLDEYPQGVPLSDLPVDEDDVFKSVLANLKELCKDPEENEACIDEDKRRLNERANALAKQLIGEDRATYLAGHALKTLKPLLDADKNYMNKEFQRYTLKNDPRNATKVKNIEDELRKMADAIAEHEMTSRLDFIDTRPEGIPIADIPLRNDHIFLALANERFQLKCNPEANANELEKLEARMNARAHELAKEMHVRERTYLDPEPEGIPLELLSLNDDAAFSKMEDDLRALNREIRKDPKAITNLENKLNDRAHELAIELVNAERDLFLEPKPEGVPIADVLLAADDIFHSMEVERLRLRKEDPRANAEAIKDLEKKMNDRAAELSRKKLEGELAFLEKAPYGIPMNELGLACDDEFKRKTMELMNLRKDPKKNAEAVKALEDKLLAMERDVARGMAALDRKFLDPEPEGRLLSDLPLDDDKTFVDMDTKRRLMIRSGAVLKKVQALEEEMNDRVHEIARSLNAKERPAYLKPAPLGVPLENLPLDLDEKFRELEATRQQLKRDLNPNMDAIADVEAALNARSEELAAKKLSDDRGYLEPEPEGIPLEFLPLGADPKFHELEVRRAVLKAKDLRGNAGAIKVLEGLLNDRTHELAKERKGEDLRDLGETSCGIPLCVMRLHDDAEFQALAAQRRRLKVDPSARAEDIDCLRNEMARRADELAWNTLQGDREYLLKYPLGVSHDLLPLNTDPVLHSLEVQRAVLKSEGPRRNATQIKGLEEKLNDRAIQLAEDQMSREVVGLDEEPEGVPLALLNLYSDSDFIALVNELRDLQRQGIVDGEDVASVKDAMNVRAHEIAKMKRREDRGFLNPAPQGVSMDILPLDNDPVFCRLEAERVKLQAQDPRRNARNIKDLEDGLNNRIFEMAQEQIREDVKGVEEMPRGIPLELLHPHSDPQFLQMVAEMRELKKDPLGNANSIANLHSAMNERVHELASEKLDRDFLKPEPLGVALTILPLDKDEVFHKLEAERAILKLKDPRRNAKKIKEVEDEMDERILKLAQLQLDDDISAVDAAPEGIELKYLKVTEDPQFAEMVIQLRSLKKNPEINADQISDLEARMNNRAHELAKSLLEGDRDYLDRDPLGDPQGVLPLDHDGVFSQMEVERAILKAQDPIRNTRKIEDLEDRLNKRVRELAEKRLEEDLRGFPTEYEGIGISLLKPHKDTVFASMVPELRRLKKEGPREALEAHVNAMDRRLNAIAEELKGGDWGFLDLVPEGVPLIDIPLSSDKKFEELRTERGRLRAQDPLTNALKIKNCEDAMNKRAHELALQVKGDDFTGLDTKFHGIPVELLSLREDPKAAKLIAALRSMKRQAVSPASKVEMRKIQDRLSARAHKIAKAALTEGQTRYLDNDPEGVPLNILPLDTDPKFGELQVERAQRRLSDPGKNAMIIEDLENKLNERAHELAKEQLEEDVRGLDMSPCGVPMHILRPHNDAEFAAAVEKLRSLKKDSTTDEGQLNDLQDAMNSMTRRMAMCLLKGDREYLDPYLFGVPIDALPLEDDQEFHAKEVKRAILKAGDSSISAVAIALLEDELESRARQLAKEQMTEDLRGLCNPKGVPLPLLHLHDDAKFTSHLPELRRLKKDPSRDGDAERAVEHKMKQRAEDIAADYLQAQRESFLSPAPLGIPLAILPLDTDQEFRTIEAERLQLMLDPKQNKDEIARLEEALNACAEKLAKQKLTIDRGYLEPEPEGIPLEFLPLGADPKFHELEVRRAVLKAKDLRGNAGAIKVLEGLLNDRTHELAKEQKGEDLRDLGETSCGIPLCVMRLHDDAEFQALAAQRRRLKVDPSARAEDIDCLRNEMARRADELAWNTLQGDREYLLKYPLGVSHDLLPLNTDPVLHSLEVQRAVLKSEGPRRNATQIKGLEEKLNDRAIQLAEDQMSREVVGLDEEPEGVPLALLNLYSDSDFIALVNELRDLQRQGIVDGEDVASVKDAMNVRAHEIAKMKRREDRGFLNPAPQGVSMDILPLDNDPVFCRLEAERVKLQAQDPRRNARNIKDLEDGLNNRIFEMAQEQIREDVKGVEEMPRGIPLELLHPHSDPQFLQMVAEMRELKKDPLGNANSIANLHSAMNERVHELASEKLDRDFLKPEPLGVALTILPLDKDEVFHKLEAERAILKLKDPRRNAKKIKEVEDEMDERILKLAQLQLDDDISAVDAAPEGIELKYLKVTEDPQFAEMVIQLRSLKKNPEINADQISDLEARMNNRAHELAKSLLEGDRDYLDRDPLGDPQGVLPLDHDGVFSQMEVERAILKAQDPIRNTRKIEDLEDRLNKRVRELAEKRLEEDLRGFPTEYEGIGISLLKPHKDTVFASMVPELRRLKKEGPREALEAHVNAMDRRLNAIAEELKGGDWGFLDLVPEGVPLIDIPLSSDKKFEELRTERGRLRAQDPLTNALKIKNCEDAMNKRAHELALQVKGDDFTGLDTKFHGIPVELLSLREDPKAAKLIAALRSMKRQAVSPASKVEMRKIQDRLSARAHKIAKAALTEGQTRYLDNDPEGVPLNILPLDTDPKFGELQVERAQRRLSDPGKNAMIIEDLENKLNERAHELAKEQLEEDVRGLDMSPCGVPMHILRPHNDAEFAAAVEKLRSLKKDSTTDEGQLNDLQDAMNSMTRRMTMCLLKGDREYLDPYLFGVPIDALPLEDDQEFHAKEVKRAILKAGDSSISAVAIALLEDELESRARQLAKEQMTEDLRGLCNPKGVPLPLLHLHDDAKFTSHLPELRRLKKDPSRDGDAERAVEHKMKQRAEDIAADYLQAQRESFLSPAPLGIPLAILPLDTDQEFRTIEAERLQLMLDPKQNKDEIARLEEALNACAEKLAKQKLTIDRGYLEPEPEGIPLEFLPLGADPKFHELEVRRAVLKAKDLRGNAGAIKVLEGLLNDRTHELAKERKGEDLRDLGETSCGIPLCVMRLHDDAEFQALAAQRRRLKVDPSARAEDIDCLRNEMARRADELAWNTLQGDREYLLKYPLGVSHDLLPLNTDPVLHSLEVQRAVLKSEGPRRNATQIKGLEEKLNDRAIQLAEDQMSREVVGLDEEPEGVPLALLNLYSDSDFIALVNELRDLQRQGIVDGEDVASVKDAMNVRAHEIAKMKRREDRGFLNPAPQGVSMDILPLDNDPVFCRLEAERVKLQAQDPRRNARNIKDLEDGLNNRIFEMAQEQIREDVKGVEEMPRGIPLELLHPHSDPQFLQMVAEMRELKKDPLGNANSIANLHSAMNERVHELASEKLDRDFLKPEPLGVALTILPLDKDEVFHKLEAERAILKLKDPRRNAKKIKEVEDEMDERILKLAQLQLDDDISAVDAAPEGIELKYLKVTEDPQFAEMVIQLRSLKKNPEINADQISDLEARMNNRAHELAKSLLEGDRDYLDRDPLGDPQGVLPLDHDGVFSQMEVERAILKAQDPIRNTRKIEDLEDRLNKRVRELAEKRLEEDLRGFPTEYEGIGISLLKPHKDTVFASMVPELRRLKKEGPREALEAHVNAMDRRLNAIAEELKGGDWGFLDLVPEGVPLIDIPLSSDKKFEELRTERGRLRAQDPLTNALKIKNCEDAMNKRAHELALQVKGDDFTGLDTKFHGIPVELLSLREDPKAAKLIAALRSMKRQAVSPASKVEMRKIQDRLSARAHKIAKAALTEGQTRYLDNDPEGVPLNILPLDTDPKFGELQVERAQRRLSDPGKNAMIIEDLENKLNERAHELAKEQLEEDVRGLDMSPCGVPMHILRPHNDAEFAAAVEKLRSLKKDSTTDEGQLNDLQDAMNSMTRRMAMCLLKGDREYLDPYLFGVPIDALPLEDDQEFHAKEVKRAILKAGDSSISAVAIALLEDELESRARQLAKEQMTEDLRGLCNPKGVPLPLLHLHDDAKFTSHLPELRRLKKDPSRDGDAERAVEHKMKQRAEDIAADYLQAQRESFLSPAPLGIPLAILPLDTDQEFRTIEAERLQLMLDPKQNKDEIARLEEALNACAEKLAKQKLTIDRGYLEPEPEGIPLEFLPLGADPKFHELEVRRAVLKAKDLRGNAGAIKVLEGLLNDRTHELAKEQKEEELCGVDIAPRGIPIELICPHSDRAFRGIVKVLRQLKKESSCDSQKISVLKADMNARAHELATKIIMSCRAGLEQLPEGIPLSALPIDEDETFHRKEVELAKATFANPKSSTQITALEDQLNSRARELAMALKANDLEGLDANPCGVPLYLLEPHKDAVFALAASERRANKSRGIPSKEFNRDKLNERARDLAEQLMSGDRQYLVCDPEGLPLVALSLHNDLEFRAMEAERATLKLLDPKRNAGRITDLEKRLNNRVHELVKEKLRGDRGYLDKDPEGISLEDLPLDTDMRFHIMEVERGKLKMDPMSDAHRITELEGRLNGRAHALAREQIKSDLEGVSPEPEGIPLQSLNIYQDKEFASHIFELRGLKNDPERNGAKIKALQNKLNEYVHKLAKEKVDADRKFLDSEPEGIPLALLPLDKDKHFRAMEKELHALQIDSGPNEAAIESLKNRLNDRAHEMAKEKIQEHRGFLNTEPGGVPLVYLPLDTDEEFHLMEVEHVKLKENPSCNAVALSKIEADMNGRARELAKIKKEETRTFLKATSYGIPRELLPLDTDTSFCGMERDLWNPKCAAHRVSLPENFREAMQKRADELGLEMLKGGRETYLCDNFCGMELADFPLDVDESFVDMELERALLNARDAALNGSAVADLEVKLRARAEDLVRAKVASDRAFLDQEPEGIPLDDLDLNEDKAFLSLEKSRRELLRDPARNARKVEAVEKDMNRHVHNKAKKLIAEYRSLLQPSYHGIPVERLNLQGNESFRQITKNMRRRKAGLTDPADIQMVEDEFHRAISEIIDGIIARERSFLDPEPEGMLLVDVPFEGDAMFISLEAEHMQRKKDPISTKNKKSVIVELENLLNDRVRALARNEFAKRRAFMNQKPEGVPLEDIPLSTDPEFRAAEIARYRVLKNTPLDSVMVKQLSARMEALARKLAKDLLARERAFLDPYPEGVPLNYLPLLTDKLFCEMVRERRKLCLHPANASQVAALESRMNEHVHALARDLVKTGRMFLDMEPLGVPIADIPLNTDEKFRKLEELRYKLSQDQSNTAALREIESQLNLRLIELAAALLAEERKFLNAAPHGIFLGDLPLNNDLPLRKIERDRRALRANTEMYAEKFAMLSDMMEKRVYDIAKEELTRDRHYLDPEPAGVALEYLPLDTDESFHQMELDRRTLRHSNKKGEKDGAIAALEEKLRQRAIILAKQFVFNERAYLDRYPEGVPLQGLPLDEDREFHELELTRRRLVRNKEKNAPKIEKIEMLLCDRVRVLALGHRNWEDPEFHEANKNVAELWPRIVDLYPEGRNFPIEPLRMHASDVRSAPGSAGYLAPFIAALARSPSLIQQLIYTKSHPINAPYSFIFYDLHGTPVRVDVDDRVPCDANLEPKFTQVPNHSWYPLLLEKAYAKFVGGYKKMDLCTPHETLRDLTGRPVLHIPFNKKLAACTGLTAFTTTKFWMGIASALERGDVFTCMSCIDALDGIHSHCSYALLGVIQTNEKSYHLTDIVIKLHNCYHDESVYSGPLCIGDPNWTKDLRWLCSYDPNHVEYIYMPLPTFLRNFASMQWCNTNCNGRLTAQGEWKGASAGGNPKLTSFRNNPIFLLENKMSRPMPVIVELRHHSPVYFDSDGVGHYHQTGLALMRAMQTHAPVTPLLTIASHKFLYRGFLLNAREVSAQIELPANATCYLIPYTLKPGSVGRFNISVYPGMAKVMLSPLLSGDLTPLPICKKLNIKPGDTLGQRVDFQVSGACDVHILLRQERMYGVSTERGDIWGDTELRMSVYDERGIKLVSTGCATNAREHSLAFSALTEGRFSVVIHSPNSASSHKCPCTLSVYTKKHIFLRFVPVPPDARPLNQLMLPPLPSIHRSQSKHLLSIEPLARSSTLALPSFPPAHLLLMKGRAAHSIN